MVAIDWQNIAVGELCEAIIDCVNKTAPTVQGPTPFRMIRTTNVKDGCVDTSAVKYVDEQTYNKWIRRGTPRCGDVILTREAPLGEVGLLRDDKGIFLGQRLVMYRVNPKKLNNRFLLYSFLSHAVQSQIKSFGSGATVEHMRVPDCEKILIPTPPLPIQLKIASVLSAYDDLIENNTKRIKILEEMAQTIYNEWFVKFRFTGHENVKMVESDLGMIPEGWEVVKLSEICNIVMGQSPKSEFYNEVGEGLPFHQGVTNFGDRYPTDSIYCTKLQRIAEPGDILFSVRAPVGRINVADKKIIIGRGLCAIRNNSNYQYFMFHQLRDKFKEEDSMGGGTIFKAVTKSDMHGINLVYPSASIIESFETIISPLSSQIQNLTYKNTNLSHTRDLLLPRLISGEIDVSELDIDLGGITA